MELIDGREGRQNLPAVREYLQNSKAHSALLTERASSFQSKIIRIRT